MSSYNPRPDLISPNLALPQRYKLRGGSRKVIGLQTGAILQVTDDASGGGETAGWTKNIDITSYAYGAVISLVNGTGAQRTISNVQIKGKVVEMLQGTEGIIHDAFIDRGSIYENGEKRIEWGNDWIVTIGQAKDIADFLWKEFRSKKHTYMLTLPGTRFNYEPDDWYRLQIGGSGQIEYIDSVVRIFQVETYRRAGELGTTQLLLKEVEEAWKDDSSAVARFIASGRTYQLPAQIGGIKVGSQYTTDKCDIYCDGTADQTEINEAIDIISQSDGGGTVHLTRGTYQIDGSIVYKSNVTLEGEGAGTVIELAGGAEITSPGGSGTEISGIVLRDLKIQRKAGITTVSQQVDFDYTDNFTINNVWLHDSYQTALSISFCDKGAVTNLTITAQREVGIWATSCTGINFSDIVIDGESGGTQTYGFFITGLGFNIENVHIKNLTGASPYGLYVVAPSSNINNIIIEDMTGSTGAWLTIGLYLASGGDTNMLSNIRVDNVDNSGTAANGHGIYVSGDDNVLSSFTAENCSGTGVIIGGAADRTMLTSGRSTNNGTNYTDGGTNTNTAAFDAT